MDLGIWQPTAFPRIANISPRFQPVVKRAGTAAGIAMTVRHSFRSLALFFCNFSSVAVPDQPGRRPPLAASVQEVQIEFESNGQYRSDGRCGPENPLEDGSLAECDPNSAYYCCSAFGFCGSTQEHCFCETCVNYRPVSLLGNGKVRSDRRCGADFPLEDGSASECDGNSANHCCSKFGYCGPGPDHCDCVGCVDFRSAVPIGTFLMQFHIPYLPLLTIHPSQRAREWQGQG